MGINIMINGESERRQAASSEQQARNGLQMFLSRRSLLAAPYLAVLLLLSQLSPAHAISIGTLTVKEIKARIFTPNGDGYNDKVRFEIENPDDLPVQGQVFDVNGARVADLQPGTDPLQLLTILLWDGKDTDGRVVAGGIYVYQIEYQGEHATGTVVVAR